MRSDSEQELEEVLKRYPELLESETIERIGKMGVHAMQTGKPEVAEGFGVIFMRLTTFGKEIEARLNTPKVVSSVGWAIKARKRLSLRTSKFLDEAIEEAQEFPEIQRFLSLFSDETAISECRSLGATIAEQLRTEGRNEEALTVELVAHHELAVILEKIDEATTEQRDLVRTAGLSNCQDAIRIARTLDDKLCRAFYTGILGTFFWKTGAAPTADFYFERALKLYRELVHLEPLSLRFLGITLLNLGNAKVQIQRYVEAKTLFEEALQIFQNSNAQTPNITRDDLASTFTSLGSIQQILGFSTRSERSFAEALAIFRSLAKEKPGVYEDRIAMTLSNLSNTQKKLNRFVEAENSLVEALEIYRELDRELADRIPYFFAQPTVLALNNLSGIKRFSGRKSGAEDMLNEALRLCRILVSQQPRVHDLTLVMTLSNLGSWHEEQEQFNDAERYLNEALKIQTEATQATQREYSKELGGLFHNLGNAQLGNGKLVAAEESYAMALRIRRNLVQEDPLFRQDLALTLRNVAYLRLAQNNPSEAESLLCEARNLVEQIRETALTLDERNRLAQDNDSIYVGLLDCYIRLREPRKALQIAEQGKSRSLSDLLDLKSSDWQPKAPTPETSARVKKLGEDYSRLIGELQQLETYETFLSEHAAKVNQNRSQQPGAERVRVQKEKFAKHSALEQVLADIAEYDKNFPPKAKQIDSETILETSRRLNRTIVIFRVLSASTAVIFVFPNGELQIDEVKDFGQPEMFALFRDHWFVPYVDWKMRNLEDVGSWQDALAQMLDLIYEKLLIHVHRVLKEKSTSRDILLVPTKSLARLPLHAASWKDANGKQRYLCEEYTISYAPSVSVFKRCLDNEKKRSNKTLLITNPKGDLSGSTEETDSILGLHPNGHCLELEQATRANVLEALKTDYGLIHFSCHGFYIQANPFSSGLVLHDDDLSLSDIINCNLQNNWLTTLSACETGMVDFQSPTDEHFSLPLGFVFGGSPSVWASLWLVSDRATSALMKNAYQNLSKEEYKNNKPEALRQAQLSMFRDFPHPFYWAGFQHFGV